MSRSLPRVMLVLTAFRYGLVAMATDYDSWRKGEDAVTASDVFKTLSANADTARFIAQAILPQLHEALTGQGILLPSLPSVILLMSR